MVDFTSKLNNQDRIVKYVVQKQDGSTLYITRDIAALLERKKKFNFSKIVYVVGELRIFYFKDFKKCFFIFYYRFLNFRFCSNGTFQKFISNN